MPVKDQGIGIAHDQQQRIFARFERGVSNTQCKGLGVGLYITKQIVLAHGGNITIESKLNAGAAFTVELPITPPNRTQTGTV